MMFLSLLLYILIIILIISFIYGSKIKKIYSDKNKLKNIPSPPSYPIIGNMIDLLCDIDTIHEKINNYVIQYYPIYKLTTLYVNIVALLDPVDIEKVLISSKHLSKSKIYEFLTLWLGTGLLTSTGSKWHSRRKILTPAFHFSILQQFIEVFNEESKNLSIKLEENCDKEIDVIPFVTHFTLKSIAETAMGFNEIEEEKQNSYKQAVYEIGRIFVKRMTSAPWYRIPSIYYKSKMGKKEKEIVKVLHNFSSSIIKEREKKFQKNNKNKRSVMLDLLFSAKAEGADLDFNGIREEVDTFMFEGHDTTSMAISFLLLTLANYPEYQIKIYEEVLDVLGPDDDPTYGTLQNLKFTERCIKETLRIFPSVPFISRYASEDFTTSTGHIIPKDTILHIHILQIHRNPRFYPDPLKFDPDRFLPENSRNRHPFAYIPFSAGPRNCIGQKFAMLEIKAVLCFILRKFQLISVDKIEDIKILTDLVLRPRNGNIKIKIIKRQTV